MIGLLIRLAPRQSLVWLVLHELRLSVAGRKIRAWQAVLGPILLLGWIAVGVAIAFAVQHVAIPESAEVDTGLLVGAILLFSFMTTQALLVSQRTLFEAGDLDLLFSAPIAPRTVMAAKLIGIAAAIALSFALMVLPLVLPIAVLGHPQLFGVPALLLALTLIAACLGLGITLLLAKIAGPRAARTVGQIVAALAGGSVFLASQLMSHGDRTTRSGAKILFDRMLESGFGSHGLGALPGKAAFGDPLATALLLGIGVALFVLTVTAMQTAFLSAYRAGTMKLGRTRRATSKVARHFHPTLFGAVFAKEWKLLARDPALAFQIVLRLIYLAPLFLAVFRAGSKVPIAPSLAFGSVVIAGQVVASLAWLAVSAEDAPDLVKVSPVAKRELDNAKLWAAMAMAAPLIALLPIAIAFETIPGALVTLAMTAFTGWMTGQLEVLYGKPAPRSTFRRRRSGSLIVGIFSVILTLVFGGVAGVAVYLLG
ncbi:hypothetical protein [Sphingomonas sp.]|uniref:hypothetical protein n=1 Tax=Sphingomonas sp. TaxID=28214 RepID=UPI001B1B0276|nr:hypothetical protein [Sphingomonas sp.]MBO9713097.1 hypothetical protein [Sphingomonas sp.]